MDDEDAEVYWCRICEKNKDPDEIAIFDVFEGCVCNDCVKQEM